MSRIRYVGPHTEGVVVEELAFHGVNPQVDRLHPVEVPPTVASSLLEQSEPGIGKLWERVKDESPAKADKADSSAAETATRGKDKVT